MAFEAIGRGFESLRARHPFSVIHKKYQRDNSEKTIKREGNSGRERQPTRVVVGHQERFAAIFCVWGSASRKDIVRNKKRLGFPTLYTLHSAVG
jgi:hypothetical protein